ncbi:unnamed protein product [Haemonchus placei]|uniref:Pseudouridine-5'-monophosphatase n=1 Tax=Haemonchus placei TaxID=6290 RepID=A0A0N4WR50_HAEPC|nr:unnamed protein product [Haemonchus placei]
MWVVGIADRVSPEEYVIEYDAMLADMFRKCNSMPGAERLVRHLASKGVPMAICTGSCSRTFAQKAQRHRDWIDIIPIHVLSGDDENIKRGKPFPDPFLETMRRFPHIPTDPSHVLVFEDAPNGVKAAYAAGMQCVMVPDQAFLEDARLLCVDNVLSSLEDFKPEEFVMKSPIKVTHLIFDVDGTLLDTEICYTSVNQAMLKKYDREFTPYMQALSPEEFTAEKDAMLAKMFPECRAFPGAERLIRHFARKQVPMAICSGSCWHKFELKATKHRSWLDLIPIKVFCGDDKAVKRGKPFPDAFIETMRR